MRSLDFIVPVDIEDPKKSFQDLRLNIDAYNWNPIHYATVYKRYTVLEFFKQTYGNTFDLIWAMQLPFNHNIEGV